jgi:hypothetical protein
MHMKKLFIVLLAAIALPAFAGTATVTWTNPTQYEDSTALAPSDIANTTVEYGTCSGANMGTVAGQVVASGAATSAVVNNLTPGTWCFRAYTTVIAAKGGGRSVNSNVASKVAPFPNPKPPTVLDAIIAFFKRLFGHFA